MNDFWVFGYGSLMWNPGFEYEETELAQLSGYHRAPCIYSWVHRGTQDRPGIVLGLAPGGACSGMAFRVKSADAEHTIAYLRERELVTNVYVEVEKTIKLHSGKAVNAITYVADTEHEQYAGALSAEVLIRQIEGSVGKSGKNEDYICDTANKLRSLKINDPLMEKLAGAFEN